MFKILYRQLYWVVMNPKYHMCICMCDYIHVGNILPCLICEASWAEKNEMQFITFLNTTPVL